MMTFPAELGALPKQWVVACGPQSDALREAFAKMFPRIAMLIQMDIEVIACNRARDRVVLRYQSGEPRYLAADLREVEKPQDHPSTAALNGPDDLRRFLEATN